MEAHEADEPNDTQSMFIAPEAKKKQRAHIGKFMKANYQIYKPV